MNESAILHLYALSLSLVPDPDVAGDLFMDARSEADLRRRAARWRAQNGLPPADDEAVLPDLTPDQREFALHLARRGRRRRQSMLALLTTAVTAVLVAAFFLIPRPVTGLAAHPAFAEEVISHTFTQSGLELSVYRATATRGSVTVWWTLTGKGAAEAARAFEPRLSLNQRNEFREPMETELAVPHPDKVYGRSRLKGKINSSLSTRFMGRISGEDTGISLMVRMEDPQIVDSRFVSTSEIVTLGDTVIRIISVSMTSTNIFVHYEVTGPDLVPNVELTRVEAGITPLSRRYLTGESRYGRFKSVMFGPKPPGATELTLYFGVPGNPEAGRLTIDLLKNPPRNPF